MNNNENPSEFYCIPKRLIIDERYKSMSTGSKFLYGLLLDQVSFSVKNKLVDEQGREYIIFPRETAQEILGYSNQKTSNLFKELTSMELIEEKRIGLGMPNIIYVKKIEW